jgi:leader peptidase (prepilin peptidase) / N-methyltransferase
MPVLLVAIGLLGLAIGSFLNVVIHRVPTLASLSHPSSRCPDCGHPIRHRHNVPVLGWLLLRGRCADCDAPISARYPVVELLTAVLFVAVTVRLVQLDLMTALPAFLWFVAAGIALAMIDLDVGRLPNVIVLPSYPILAVLLTAAALVSHDPAALVRAVVGGSVSFALYYATALAFPGGMGFGDVKLAGVVGGMLAFVSYPVLLVGVAVAFLLGAATGLLAMATGRATRKSTVPFGPFMLAGAVSSIFVGGFISTLYTTTLLPS